MPQGHIPQIQVRHAIACVVYITSQICLGCTLRGGESEMVKFLSNLLGILKSKGINVEYLRCDNAGEHMSKLITLY